MITRNKLNEYCGLSTDDKNSIKDANAIFHEMDTDKYYARTIDNWGALPHEYTQVKYLETNGTKPYIDTEWVFNARPDVYVEVVAEIPTATMSGSSFLMGYKDGNYGFLMGASYNKGVLLPTFNGYGTGSTTMEFDTIYTYTSKWWNGPRGEGNYWFFDGAFSSINVRGTTTPGNCWLFSVWYSTASRRMAATVGRIYSFKVAEYDKIAVDMVPCIRDADGKPGMYDVARNKFYTNLNTTEGSEFTYKEYEWQDITNVINKDWKHIPPDPVLPKINPILPEGYAECEYVYTDGTALATRAIIDTGYAYEDPDGIRIVSTYKVCTDDTNDGYPAFGVDFFRTGSTRQMHGHMWKNGLYLGQGRVATADSYYLNTKITLDFTFENNTATWVITDHDNNTTETKTYSGNNGWVGSVETDYLGSLHKIPTETNDTENPANDDDIYLKGNIYRHIMYHHNEKVRDFVPCLRLADGIAGMYELVEGKFYRSSFLPKIYGFHVDSTNSDPSGAVTYTDDAVGMTPAAMNFTTGVFNYGDWEDAFFMPRPCMLYSNGTVAYYLNPNDYTKKEDGTASDIANVDFDGNAMMEWGDGKAAIWMSIVADSGSTTSYTVRFANYRPDSTYHAWNFYNKDNELQWHFYTPIYDGYVDSNNKLRSLSGQTPTREISTDTFMQYAKSNGSGWNVETWADKQFMIMLLYLMGKSLNLKATYGYGGNPTATGTGILNTKGLFYGDEDGSTLVKVFGMESPWGILLRAIAGIQLNYTSNSTFYEYYKLTEGTADGSTATSYSFTDTSGMISSGPYTPTADSEPNPAGYLTKFLVTDSPKTALPYAFRTGGSASTYYCSFLYCMKNDLAYPLAWGVQQNVPSYIFNYTRDPSAYVGASLSYRLPTT